MISIAKLILSCSPDEDEENCRALMINNTGYGTELAFCCPGRSKEWTLMFDERSKRMYDDCVYSTTLELFFVLTTDTTLESWDLRDLSSPKLIKIAGFSKSRGYFSSSVERLLKVQCGSVEHLVVAKGELLLAIQHIMVSVGPDGSCYDHLDERLPNICRHMTVGFDVFKYDSENRKLNYLDSSFLSDLALFVGSHSQSVAIQASRFPELKPNSVYFTDGWYTGSVDGDDSYDDEQLRGHDIGIFNYQNKTVSPCYYPIDAPSVKTILPAPIWFFPSHTI